LNAAIKKLAADGVVDQALEETDYSDELKQLLSQSFEEIPFKYNNSIEKANSAIKLGTGLNKCLYLLLDGRLWKPGGTFLEFINAIFYIG